MNSRLGPVETRVSVIARCMPENDGKSESVLLQCLIRDTITRPVDLA